MSVLDYDQVKISFSYKKTFERWMEAGILDNTAPSQRIVFHDQLLAFEKMASDYQLSVEYHQLAANALLKIMQKNDFNINTDLDIFKKEFDLAYQFILTPMRHFKYIFVEHSFLEIFVDNFCNQFHRQVIIDYEKN